MGHGVFCLELLTKCLTIKIDQDEHHGQLPEMGLSTSERTILGFFFYKNGDNKY